MLINDPKNNEKGWSNQMYAAQLVSPGIRDANDDAAVERYKSIPTSITRPWKRQVRSGDPDLAVQSLIAGWYRLGSDTTNYPITP